MILRQRQSGGTLRPGAHKNADELGKKKTGKFHPIASRKPSERFMRGAVRAKPKASNSERIRIADLKERLEGHGGENMEGNNHETFKGYRPGMPS